MNFTTPEIYGLLGLIALGVVGAALVALFVAALLSVVVSERYTGAGKILWILALCAFPFFGPVLWFLVGRTHRLEVDRGGDAGHRDGGGADAVDLRPASPAPGEAGRPGGELPGVRPAIAGA